MNIISFIPARGGSKGIPRKNIKPLGGKPLIAYSIEVSLACDLRTIVDTDDPEIADIAREYGAEVMEVSPEEARERGIHQDESSMYQVLKSEIPRIDPIPDAVLLMQPTSPFRTTKEIKLAIAQHRGDSLIFVERVPEKWNPAQVMVITPEGTRMADGRMVRDRITRRQDFEDAWVPTGSLYIFNTRNLEKGSMYGERVILKEVEPTININTMEDFAEAERFATQLREKASNVPEINEDPADKLYCIGCE